MRFESGRTVGTRRCEAIPGPLTFLHPCTTPILRGTWPPSDSLLPSPPFSLCLLLISFDVAVSGQTKMRLNDRMCVRIYRTPDVSTIQLDVEGKETSYEASSLPLALSLNLCTHSRTRWATGPVFPLSLPNPCPWPFTHLRISFWREDRAARSVRERGGEKSEAWRTAWRRRSLQLASCISELLIPHPEPGLRTDKCRGQEEESGTSESLDGQSSGAGRAACGTACWAEWWFFSSSCRESPRHLDDLSLRRLSWPGPPAPPTRRRDLAEGSLLDCCPPIPGFPRKGENPSLIRERPQLRLPVGQPGAHLGGGERGAETGSKELMTTCPSEAKARLLKL
ncbi:uncharacterized protein LOC123597156 [Leopardus geoffroyi]|uniref:uncharacterized protein LOC123597156 n=1 Tax=Leopardus geoffroyi TaxID=46844 RepID=UPI001E263E88|nr:uncharacterized protein LOC123597156 [Leopardus geoffroyi]